MDSTSFTPCSETGIQSVIDAIALLDAKLHKQAAILAKAPVACASNKPSQGDEVPWQPEIPSRILALRQKREDAQLSDVRRGPAELPPPTVPSAAQNCAEASAGRVAELELEIEALKRKHRSQLMVAEREIARLSRMNRATPRGNETSDTPLASTQLAHDV